MRFSLSGSTVILVSGEVKIIWNFAGDRPSAVAKTGLSERVRFRQGLDAERVDGSKVWGGVR